MVQIRKEVVQDLLGKYRAKLAGELDGEPIRKVETSDYLEFRSESLPAHLTLYERMCAFAGKVLSLKADQKKNPLLQRSIDAAHLHITPGDAVSFGILVPLALILFGSILAFLVLQSLFFVIIILVLGAIIIKPLS